MGEIFNELPRVQPAITTRHARPRRDTKCIFNCFMHKTTKAPSRGGYNQTYKYNVGRTLKWPEILILTKMDELSIQ